MNTSVILYIRYSWGASVFEPPGFLSPPPEYTFKLRDFQFIEFWGMSFSHSPVSIYLDSSPSCGVDHMTETSRLL